MVVLDEDALICDFAETYHIYDFWSLPLQLAATLAAGLWYDSRIMMRLSGDQFRVRDLLLATLCDKMTGTKFLPIMTGTAEKEEKTQVYDSPDDFWAAREEILRRINSDGN